MIESRGLPHFVSMKSSVRFFKVFVSAGLGGALLLSACASLPVNLQNPVAQTQQGIPVALNIYGSSQQTQQQFPPVRKNFVVTVMTPDFSKPLKSPITIHGTVSGLYFFEAVFPIVLQDAQGHEIARAQAHADGEWMTDADVTFTAKLIFVAPKNKSAKLVFQKDNPSGLPENDFSQSFPVTLQ